jgi:cytochrome b involved in lipid metabolism
MAPEAETFVEDPAAEESRQAGLASRRKARFEDNVQRRYSLQEVAKHDVPKDCWLIIRGKVYDVSTW